MSVIWDCKRVNYTIVIKNWYNGSTLVVKNQPPNQPLLQALQVPTTFAIIFNVSDLQVPLWLQIFQSTPVMATPYLPLWHKIHSPLYPE